VHPREETQAEYPPAARAATGFIITHQEYEFLIFNLLRGLAGGYVAP